MSNKNPGFNKENVVMVDASETDTKKIYPLFKQALSAITCNWKLAVRNLVRGRRDLVIHQDLIIMANRKMFSNILLILII